MVCEVELSIREMTEKRWHKKKKKREQVKEASFIVGKNLYHIDFYLMMKT